MRWDDEVGRNARGAPQGAGYDGGALEDQQLFLPDTFPPPPAANVVTAAMPTTPPAEAPAEEEVVFEVLPEPLEPLIEDPFVEAPFEAPFVEAPPVPPVDLPVGKVVAVVNQKGGVGKTTSTINLGAALAAEGAKVLLVDFDPQGALSVGLGLNPNSLDLTVYNLLLDASVTFDEVVQHCKMDGLDLIPSNIDLAGAEIASNAHSAVESQSEAFLL